MKNIFKANSESKTGKAIFYTFEISALVVGVFLLIYGICNAALTAQYNGGGIGFVSFLESLAKLAFDVLVIYGIGRILDFFYCKHEKKTKETNNENEKSE
ncbi:MAG: hypothetical protein J6J24_01510 [Clostridia bacterium]|nr:hypothetical protein [Clostridia bacterium]